MGIIVSTPKGFYGDHSFQRSEIKMPLLLSSVIKEIVIERFMVTQELDPGGSKIAAIQRKVDSLCGARQGRP